ncbi:MAG: phage tail assembly chaperone [Rhizobiaceae bacterium]|nr:phage tail assembly chaperone [Rhizobiaceae bacterium]
MALGFGLLRLPPRDFWSMTPREIASAMPAAPPREAPGRDDLAALMTAFPDSGDGSGWQRKQGSRSSRTPSR